MIDITYSAKIWREPLWWQVKGLSYTASGYGRKIPTEYMCLYKGHKRRVYCMVYSNNGSAYIIVNGKEVFITHERLSIV